MLRSCEREHRLGYRRASCKDQKQVPNHAGGPRASERLCREDARAVYERQ